MNLSSVSINRPVLATVMSIVIVLFGIIGFFYLGIREYPSVDPPVISVSTAYPGANAEVIQSQITEPLEESINGIEGISNISSTSSEGRSIIVVEFILGTNMEAAANDVRDRVSRALNRIPKDADPPVVTKSDADANPILSVLVQSDHRNLLELSDIANNVFKERLQTIPGVSEIRIWGEKKYAIRLRLDPVKMAAFSITPQDIQTAVNRENVELPSGRIEGYKTELSIRTLGRLNTPDEYNNLIIREENGSLIRLSDVGVAEFAPENERTLLRGNNLIPMVGVALIPQPGSNYIAIADEFFKRLDQLKKEIPSDINTTIGLDTTKPIRRAITEVEETLLMAFLLVVLVIFLFLRNWRTTLIPVIAIPISLISTFFIMYIAGFSINVLTLLAIVLATGLVVDDAIVVMENIYHKIEAGLDPIRAGHEGSREIIFAIISTTITLAAVFIPVIFLQGLTGRLFREFGIVVAGAVLVSAFVSLTLTPMMSSRLIRLSKMQGKFYTRTESQINTLIDRYGRSLRAFMKRPWLALIIMGISLGMIFVIGAGIPSELAPLEDKSQLRISSTAPEGTSFDLMDNYLYQVAAIIDSMNEKQAMVVISSPGFASGTANSGFGRILLKDPSERKKTQQQLAGELNRKFSKLSFARTFVTQEQTIGSSRGSSMPVQFVIQAPDFERLKDKLPLFYEKAVASKTFQIVDVNLKFNKPEMKLLIDRDKARTLGVSVNDIAQTLQLFFSGQRLGYFIRNDKLYQIMSEAYRTNRDDPSDILSLYVRNNKGLLVKMDNLVTLAEESRPPQLFRFNRYLSATISAAPAEGLTLGQGLDEMYRIAGETLDDTFFTSLTGASKDYAESRNSLMFAFLLAIVLIFLVLAAQFESYRDPFIIMLTVPLAMAGAIATLGIFGHTLNIFSQIGIIALIGIVTKNGILIVEFANQKKIAGLDRTEAVIQAAVRRLRPILMTSMATILGALPIALGLGAASKSRVPMGITIIGGLLFSLILTLYVIPALYSYLSSKKPNIIHHDE
ncbi:MAG TPA: efflux RND transporter permease subunit [Bacteroidales bacterium]|nr:efflux RND transporter permease subunit [Bacteroidales bacterium]HSA43284.1 efflux RND transporter permease subunit [Bacteroidales bacterium]